MRPLIEYAKLIASRTEGKKSDAAPYPLYDVPPSIGGADTPANRTYADASTWAEAQRIWFRVLGTQETKAAGNRHAQFVLKTLHKEEEIARVAPDLPAICERHLQHHGNSSNAVFTLHSQAGATATGTRSQLAAVTGLAYERVRDLTNGRRRFTKGWALTEEEARRGYNSPGRPRKPDPAPEPYEFFQPGEAEFF